MIVYEPPIQHPHSAMKVVLMSGLSDPSTCALTDAQTAFLSSLQVPESCKIYRNFPFLPVNKPYSKPPIWLASWRNAQQFRQASHRRYRRAAQQHLKSVAVSTSRLVVITLSCGLEILNHCLRGMETQTEIVVIALGPVAWKRPVLPHLLVQGSGDSLSRFFFRSVEWLLPDVGHMGYIEHTPLIQLVNEHLCSSTFESLAPDSIYRRSS